MADPSDEELIAQYRAAGSGPKADALIGKLFQRYQSKVALWCYRISGQRDSSADLAQDVFLKAFRNLDSFRGDSRFSTWLYSVARNHCFNEAKSRFSHSDQPIEPLENILVDPQPSPLDTVEKEDTESDVREMMRRELTETESRVLVMFYGEEIPLHVVTRLLGLENASGAKAYLMSARRKLSTVLRRRKARESRTEGR
jgi:RNA polymerase sigma-70 factor (ECF subfamily)